MTKYILAALALLVLLAGAYGVVEHERAKAATVAKVAADERAKAAEMALSKAKEQAALLRETSLARQQELNRLRQVAEDRKKALDEALKASPDWARTPVPDGVWDALTRPAAAAGQAGPGVDGADARTRSARGAR